MSAARRNSDQPEFGISIVQRADILDVCCVRSLEKCRDCPVNNALLLIFGGSAGALAAALVTFLIGRRKTSGSVVTSEAVDLWTAVRDFQAILSSELAAARVETKALRDEAIALRVESVALREEAIQARRELVLVRKEAVVLRSRLHELGEDLPGLRSRPLRPAR